MSMTSAPAPQPPDLWDIGSFLARGLNLTPELARDMVTELQSRLAAGGGEHDQDDYVTVEYDIVAHLVAGFDRLLQLWEEDAHTAVIGEEGWSVEHPLSCRTSRDMASCAFHQQTHLAALGLRDSTGPGRYALTIVDGELITEKQP